MAQVVVTRYLELLGKPAFLEDSHGVRPGRSALGAVATTSQGMKKQVAIVGDREWVLGIERSSCCWLV